MPLDPYQLEKALHTALGDYIKHEIETVLRKEVDVLVHKLARSVTEDMQADTEFMAGLRTRARELGNARVEDMLKPGKFKVGIWDVPSW